MQADIQQELVASQQDFGQAFRPGEQFPLGEQGELVERVDLTPNGKGRDSCPQLSVSSRASADDRSDAGIAEFNI